MRAALLSGAMESQSGRRRACLTTQNHDELTPGRVSYLPRVSTRTTWLIAILLAILHAFMAVTAVNTKSPTFDEPQHLTAGYSYFATHDFRLDPENGALPAMWAALPLVFGDTKFIP